MRSASGSQYVSSQTPRPTLAPSDRSHTFKTGVPVAARANHGAATISTKVSTTSLRQTNELHSGYSTARVRPTSTHLAALVTAPATAPATNSTMPDSSAATPQLTRLISASYPSRAPTPIATVNIVGTSRQASTSARAALSLAGGAKVRLWSAA